MIFFKNQGAFPQISKLLGTRFSGNGDLINFAVRCSDDTDGKREPRIIDGGHGPVITSTIRFPDQLDGEDSGDERGFYIQDAGYPEFVNWMLQVFETPNEIEQVLHIATRFVKGIRQTT